MMSINFVNKLGLEVASWNPMVNSVLESSEYLDGWLVFRPYRDLLIFAYL